LTELDGDVTQERIVPINGREPALYEEDIQREELGPRGVPGDGSPAKMTQQREKKMPKAIQVTPRDRAERATRRLPL
jgi:hypothetical protein